ncbi:MAG: hypothetical protein KGQ59_12210 [Bdellovibrionales bacterium]|nr:hypothetical protein [Bdellovibrionales bacterium]
MMEYAARKHSSEQRTLGQATTEYLLVLVIVFALAQVVFTTLKPFLKQFYDGHTRRLDAQFTQGLYRFR